MRGKLWVLGTYHPDTAATVGAQILRLLFVSVDGTSDT